MFDPRMLQDPILMALLQSIQQQPQSMGQQTNPNIMQDPSGVYRNIQRSNEPQALPFALPGDTGTEQYLRQLAAESAAHNLEIEARRKRDEAELGHSRALELEGMKQTGSTEREGLKSQGEITKQTITSLANILDAPETDMNAQSKVDAIKQLMSGVSQITQRTGTPSPTGNPVDLLKGEIEKFRKQGVSDDQIARDIMADAQANPQFMDAAKQAIAYLESSKAKTKPLATAAPSAAQSPRVGGLNPEQEFAGAAQSSRGTGSAREFITGYDQVGHVVDQVSQIEKAKGPLDAAMLLQKLVPILPDAKMRAELARLLPKYAAFIQSLG
jgi:hypothetical protein